MAGYYFKLFLVGKNTFKNQKIIEAVKKALEQVLKNAYELEVIDVLKNPQVAVHEGILVTPTLLKSNSDPERRIVGDFTDQSHLLKALGLSEAME